MFLTDAELAALPHDEYERVMTLLAKESTDTLVLIGAIQDRVEQEYHNIPMDDDPWGGWDCD